MHDTLFHSVLHPIPPGAWAVGVSGGADSVALLTLLLGHPDFRLHIVHLNHQTRGAESDADAAFVAALAARHGLPCTVALLGDVEQAGAPRRDNNTSARYRIARLSLFARVVHEHSLRGVILAHHADDQAETVLLRLLRNSPPSALSGMSARSRHSGLLILRPLLGIRCAHLRQLLNDRGESWREDSSNASVAYERNRVRGLLADHEGLIRSLLDLATACAALRRWMASTAPRLPDIFPSTALADLPSILARESARRWLVHQGCPARELTTAALDRLVEMAADAASPPRQIFPGRRSITRRHHLISAG